MKAFDIAIIVICIVALVYYMVEGFLNIQKQGFKSYWNSLERKYNTLLFILALYILANKFNI